MSVVHFPLSITRVVLATGIYPPEIGGPATYVRSLAEELARRGIAVTVVTYAHRNFQFFPQGPSAIFPTGTFGNFQSIFNFSHRDLRQFSILNDDGWPVIYVSPVGGSFLRWFCYAKALKEHAIDADVVIAFSSVSAGVPLWMARLKKPRKILRLGGDFFWERYTDHGGMKGLREWYTSRSLVARFSLFVMSRLLSTFDHIVFSTRFQEEVYEKHYKKLPKHSVIENAMPSFPLTHSTRSGQAPDPSPAHTFAKATVGRAAGEGIRPHDPFRLLFMGRFVGFKNLLALVRAVGAQCPTSPRLRGASIVPLHGRVTLTLIGEGPMESHLRKLVAELSLQNVVKFHLPVHGEAKQRVFREHDLLVLPSLTEISPNVALEARAAGLPVLLTEETGLSKELAQGMFLRDLHDTEKIQSAILQALTRYDRFASPESNVSSQRGWHVLAEEWLRACDL